MKNNSLTSQVIKGGGWMVAARVLTKAIGVVVTIILARLLTPDAFGLVAVGLISVNILKVLTEVGIKQALIKETSENTEMFLNTAWTVELIRGLLIFVLVFITAPYITSFFNQPCATDIIRAMALVPLFNGLTNIKIIYLQKELEFNKYFFYEISPIFGSLFISVPLAFILQNVWAIVIGTVASELLRVFLSYYLIFFKPKLELNTGYFKQMFGFGKWIFVSTIVSYFAIELDTYFAAKVFDARLLGIYTLAFAISTNPIIEVGKALTKVFFPAFAKMNNDLERVRKAFLKSTTVLYLILVPISICLYLISESFVEVFLGNKWLEMIEPLKILAIATLFRSGAISASGLFNGLGRPEFIFHMIIVRTISVIIFILLALQNFTLSNLSFAVLGSNIIVSFYFHYLLYKYINIRWNILLKAYFPIGIATLFMFSIGTLFKIINLSQLYSFFGMIFLSLISYSFVVYMLQNRFLYLSISKNIKNVRNNFSKK